MSQAGDVSSTSGPVPPYVATTYHTNSGDAVPAANILNVLGVNGTTTSGAGNTVTISSPNGPLALLVSSQTFTSSGTYTPTSGTAFAIIEVQGSGGGGGGSTFVAAAGGGAGGYAKALYSAVQLGASQAVTIGAGGSGGAAGFNDGAQGGTTSVGALISATGGFGGEANDLTKDPPPQGGLGGLGTVSSGTSIIATYGQAGFTPSDGDADQTPSGQGGSSIYGAGGLGSSIDDTNGANGLGYGSGGAGGRSDNNDTSGGNGASGIVTILEFHVVGLTSGETWSDASGVFTAAVDNGYFLTAASTVTLPASPSEGDQVNFIVDTAGTCTITANAGQRIRIGASQTGVAGSVTNTSIGDALQLVFRASDLTWISNAFIGTFT